MRKFAFGLAAFAIAWCVFALGALVGHSIDQPYCPTEDSCTVDYHDGQWTITEVTP